MTAVVAGAEVVLELAAEPLGEVGVLEEDGALAVTFLELKGGRGDVLGYPERVLRATIVGGDEGVAGCQVVDGTGEAILEEAGWIDGRDYC